MPKKYLWLFLVFAVIIFINGCGTIAGTAKGFGKVFEGAAEGAKNDWNALKKIDSWMRKNLW